MKGALSRIVPLGLLLLVMGLVSCASAPQDLGPVADSTAGSPQEQIDRYLKAQSIAEEQMSYTGLVYIIEQEGESEKPTIQDEISIHYRGYLVDGTLFDYTTGSPRTFPLSQLIPAWQEAIPLIGKGGKIKILAPPSLAYGSNPPPGTPITAETVLVFDIELVDF